MSPPEFLAAHDLVAVCITISVREVVVGEAEGVSADRNLLAGALADSGDDEVRSTSLVARIRASHHWRTVSSGVFCGVINGALLRTFLFVSAIAAFWNMNSLAPADDAAIKGPVPADFPHLRGWGTRDFLSSNGSGLESKLSKLHSTNAEDLRRLSAYTPTSVASVFGERMRKASDVHEKLLLAAVAASHGNAEARTFIEKMAETTAYDATLSRLSALKYLAYSPNPQEWVFDSIHDALSDTRMVTEMEKTTWQRGTQFSVSYVADELEGLTHVLGNAKKANSVPVLIEMAERTGGARGPVAALGWIGDPRAIPVCLELLGRDHDAGKEFSEELLRALGQLKAAAAVPTLLHSLHSPAVIEALGNIGDERAIEPLRRVLREEGRTEPDPSTWEGRFRERTFAARIALIKLEAEDPLPKWISTLEDASLDDHQRWKVVKELGARRDPRTIPLLLSLAKSDSYGALRSLSISVLSTYKYKSAVAGLIECFEAEYEGTSGFKASYSRAEFLGDIGRALQKLTGNSFGTDNHQWVDWWNRTGRHLDELK